MDVFCFCFSSPDSLKMAVGAGQVQGAHILLVPDLKYYFLFKLKVKLVSDRTSMSVAGNTRSCCIASSLPRMAA